MPKINTRGEIVTKEQSSQPESIADLEPKMQLEGVVKRIELYGAFVDVGLERDGLVHISQMSDRRVDRVSDVVQEGDKVTVWVTNVDADKGRIGLALVEPPDLEWRELKEGQTYTGRVVRIERYGIFADIGAERPGLLHVREMNNMFFRHPSEVFHEGDEVEVRITQLNHRKHQIDLGLADVSEMVPEEEAEDLPTAVELAFRKAQEEARRQQRKEESAQSGKKKRRTEQEEILDRTLRQHKE